MKTRLIAALSLPLVCLLLVGCLPARDFDTRLSSIVKSYHFSVVGWEFKAIPREVNSWIFGSYQKIDDEVSVVTEYFSVIERIKTLEPEIEAINAGKKQGDSDSLEAELNMLLEQKTALRDTVEQIMEKQIVNTLAQEGIFNPIDRYIRLKINFPPLNFKLEQPPHLLVISPRDSIESIRRITLKPGISLEEIEDIEAEVDKLGVSSLVVELGGLGATYPSFVTDEASLPFTIDAATEEWLHQYLTFTPLGFLYLLDSIGVSRNYEVVIMNETVASMASKEIGAIVVERYYPQYENGDTQTQVEESEFDFNQEMREIRRAVDSYLTRGEIEQAEMFMEQKRQYLASRGYYIRKLNQAYFAFYSIYADSPTSISPIGVELEELRSQSSSLKDFLDKTAAMTSRQDLVESVK